MTFRFLRDNVVGLCLTVAVFAGVAYGQNAAQGSAPQAQKPPSAGNCPTCPTGTSRATASTPDAKTAQEVKEQRETKKTVLDAVRAGSLHDAAKVSGGTYVTDISWSPFMSVQDLKGLGTMSAVVVTGTIMGTKAVVSGDGRLVSTIYDVSVIETHKRVGLPPGASTLRVRVPGGRIVFDDGCVVEMNVRGLPALNVGDTYTLFLSREGRGPTSDATDPARFVPALGGASIFHLDKGGRVESYGRPTDEVTRKFGGATTALFLRAVRSVVQ